MQFCTNLPKETCRTICLIRRGRLKTRSPLTNRPRAPQKVGIGFYRVSVGVRVRFGVGLGVWGGSTSKMEIDQRCIHTSEYVMYDFCHRIRTESWVSSFARLVRCSTLDGNIRIGWISYLYTNGAYIFVEGLASRRTSRENGKQQDE